MCIRDSVYTVLVDGRAWFDSKGASLGFGFSSNGATFSLAEGSMAPVGGVTTGVSTDAAGSYDWLEIGWAASGSHTVDWTTRFKAYHERSVLCFVQSWPGGATNTSGSTFPSLRHVNSDQLGVLEYTGSSCGFMVGPSKGFPGITGGQSKGYSVILPMDTTGNGANVSLAIGPSTEQFVNQARNSEGSLCYGVASSFEAVPVAFSVETVLVAGMSSSRPERVSVPSGGVNAALFEYGDFQLALHGKERARGNHTRETAYLGYSTTAFYFYNLCDCLDPAPLDPATGKPNAHSRWNCSLKGSSIPSRFLSRSAVPGSCVTYELSLIHISEPTRLLSISYAVFCLKKKKSKQ
eukprot:TRINITY_DN9171_c0_g1_i1.p1 TRINITY_DN9171_c0_g1~~TRINITY_DN9171_c0_g1_i1.p1  ORF type:complete len:350 (-),score=65.30 TRINITY_DN9171_c0_g1_i1:47-1096(-)